MPESLKQAKHPVDHLSRHLSFEPAHRGLIRALEARFYHDVTLEHPVLDIGCGDGYFAVATFPPPIDVGIDPSFSALTVCARHKIYNNLQQASGEELPFRKDSFATVVSNCVLEHVPPLDETLCEISRVLKPGGRFIGTMVTDQMSDLLGFPRLFRFLGFAPLATRYAAWLNRKAVHFNMLPAEEWRERLGRAGLRVIQTKPYLCSDSTRVFDFLHYYALPSAFFYALTRRWLIWQDPRNVALIAALLRKTYERDSSSGPCSCIFVQAVKT